MAAHLSSAKDLPVATQDRRCGGFELLWQKYVYGGGDQGRYGVTQRTYQAHYIIARAGHDSVPRDMWHRSEGTLIDKAHKGALFTGLGPIWVQYHLKVKRQDGALRKLQAAHIQRA